ncbi:MAG: hypothetical protein J6X55_05745 [Victivallales bacterium]|nr:hypothetical protein [Victivallales bacterium]
MPGESYRFRIRIRTKGLKCDDCGFVAFGPGWNKSFGIQRKFPENTDWVTLDEVHQATTERSRIYSFAIYVSRFRGELEVAAPEIIPVSEKAVANAHYVREDKPLKPVYPNLKKVEASDNVVLRFRDYSRQLGTLAYAIDGGAVKKAIPSGNGFYRFEVGKLAEGQHSLSVDDGDFTASFVLTVIPPAPKVDVTWRNNFNGHRATIAMKAGPPQTLAVPATGTVRFTMPEEASITVNGVSCANGEFVHLLSGTHELALTQGNEATVEASWLVETSLYPLANGPLNVSGLKPLDYAHASRHQLPVFSSFISHGKHISDAQIKELINAGHHRFYGSNSMASLTQIPLDGKSADEFFAVRLRNPNISDTVIIDEIENNIPFLTQFVSDLFRTMSPLPRGQNIHIWLCGRVVYPSAFTADFLQTTASVSRDMIHYFEIYPPTERTEVEARKSLDEKFTALKQLLEMSTDTIGVALSYCNLPFTYWLDAYPHVNFKYFLDMQFHLLANAPEYHGLRAINFWGDHYGDCEISRFAAALLKHYVIEGRKEMFTKEFGYVYAPGYLQNPDFEQGLEGWEANGAVEVAEEPFFGKNWQRRVVTGTTGDNFAVFTRHDGAANTLRQQARGLEPGKVYSLAFISGDAERLRQLNHQKGEINCSIEGAELLDEYTEHSARSEKDRGNYDKLVFKALRSNPLISFSDEKSAVGTKSYVSCVSLMPYFLE